MEYRSGEPSDDLQVASDTVHAVLNELTVVVMHTGELLSRLPPDDPQRPALEEIQRAAYSATKLLRFPLLPQPR
jgi:hypothetical protein